MNRMECTPEQLKQAELDIFKHFLAVCEKLNLKYYLLGGTLLGAVRHRGFIPWEDDIDVGMPRKDYEIFVRSAQQYLPETLFVQSILSEPTFHANFAKIRNSETTFIETTAKKLKINHGIYIDIFPLDYHPDDEKEQRIFFRRNKSLQRKIATVFYIDPSSKTFISKIRTAVLKILHPNIHKFVLKREELIKSCKDGTKWANYCGAWGKKEIVPKEWYGDGMLLDFEGLKVNAPSHYHEWLTQVYGDYMQLPPVEKRIGHHYTEIIDVNKSYREYTEKHE